MNMRGCILSLFPGADLFSRPFEELGWCVVRGPEYLLGQDIRGFHVPAGCFAGVIGGPPCQCFSRIGNLYGGSRNPDLIGEFFRVVDEAGPLFVVMENVPEAVKSPAWPKDYPPVILSDWDCGGETRRRRSFLFRPFDLYQVALSSLPPSRVLDRRTASYSVLASSWKKRPFSRSMHTGLSAKSAGRLQGYPGLGCEFSTRASDRNDPMTRQMAVHLFGNGVPRAMGKWVAGVVNEWWSECQ